jgi:hypothetical protein
MLICSEIVENELQSVRMWFDHDGQHNSCLHRG